MPIATPQQYRDMIDAARGGEYAYPAVNVSSSETLNAALRGFAEARSDGIVQITTSAAEYLSGSAEDMATGAQAFAEFAHVLAERSPVLIALHTDHATAERVDDFIRPLLRESRRRLERGRQPLFNSHMFDGSELRLADNLRISAELLAEANDIDVVLELEIGTVGGEEDGINHEHVARERLYTTREDALRVADTLGTGERGRYLLAATFGNVHGLYAPGKVQLRPEILREGQDALAAAHPAARFQYVFHGSSGSSEKELRDAVRYGVVKVNVDTDMQYASTRAVADHVLTHYAGVLKVDGGVGDKDHYDPRSWGGAAEAAMADAVAKQCVLVGSAGRTLAR